MADASDKHERSKTAHRGEPVVMEIVDAVLEELARVGYRALRIEDVAALAKVHKTTVYRRFPTKESLVQATLERAFRDSIPMPETGSLRGDLIEVARQIALFMDSLHGRALVRLVMTEGKDEELRRIVDTLRVKREAVTVHVVERAVSRGELEPDADGELLMSTIVGSIHHTIFSLGEVPDTPRIEALVDLVLFGALRADPDGRRPPRG